MVINGAELSNYSVPDYAFDCIYRNADDFMFGMHHGKHRDDCALRFMGARTTYGELDAKVEVVARALYSYGIRQGDAVTILLPNVPECVHYMYACWRIGAVANMIDARTHGEGVLERTAHTNSKLLVTITEVCEPKVDDILDRLPVKNVILVSPSDGLKGSLKLKPVLGSLLYGKKNKEFAQRHNMGAGSACKYIWHSDFIEGHDTDELVGVRIRANYQRGMTAAIVYTSGTSADGAIKGAVVTHEALNAAPVGFFYSVRPEDYGRRDTFGGFGPFFSSYGLFCGLHTPLCGGMELILVPIFNPEKFAELVLELKCNLFLGVPRFFEQLADYPKFKKPNNLLSFVKMPIAGGDKISLASLERINATFKRSGFKGGLRIGYGSTELGASIAVMPYYEPGNTDFPWQAEGNVGYLLPHVKALVLDPETKKELPLGQDGELCLRSLSQMECYYGEPEKTAEITFMGPDGEKFYHMGDKGHLDKNGIFYFLDRYKRSVMRPDGHTVHPAPIENAIMKHEAVEICAVVGLKYSETGAGTITSAFIVLRDGYDSPEAQKKVLLDIHKLCLRSIPERDCAFAYKVVKEVPYTPMGKIHFRELEKEFFDPKAFLLTNYQFFPELDPNPAGKGAGKGAAAKNAAGKPAAKKK